MSDDFERLPDGLPGGFDDQLQQLLESDILDPSNPHVIFVRQRTDMLLAALRFNDLVPDGLDISGVTTPSDLWRLGDNLDPAIADFADKAHALAMYYSVPEYVLDEQTRAELGEYMDSLEADAINNTLATLAEGDDAERWLAVAEELIGPLPLPTDPKERAERLAMLILARDTSLDNLSEELSRKEAIRTVVLKKLAEDFGIHDDLPELVRVMFRLAQSYSETDPELSPLDKMSLEEIRGYSVSLGIDLERLLDDVALIKLCLKSD